MLSLKKRLIVFVALVMMLVATVVPAAAQDDSTPSPTPNTVVVTIQLNNWGGVVALSLPVRCGNDC